MMDSLILPMQKTPTYNFVLPVIQLTASPAGGTFTGSGVRDTFFFPFVAGVGSHELTYRYGEGTVCYSEIKKTVSVIEKCLTGIPNAFTPNGDGINDVFRMPQGSLQTLSAFTIYDMWGEKIFSSKTLSGFWDGKIKGQPANSGIYVYLVSGIKADGSPVQLKGTVTLIR